MKNRRRISTVFALFIIMSFVLSGCGEGTGSKIASNTKNVDDVLKEKMAESTETEEEIKETAAEDATDVEDNGDEIYEDDIYDEDTEVSPLYEEELTEEETADGIDVDLTTLSSTMVYSEVYAMMMVPEDYMGKTIKMTGLYNLYQDANTDQLYFSCIVQDATACCAQGIEFKLTDDFVYPDDYPEVGDEITVVGVFDTYEENGYKYAVLREASLL